MAYAFVVCVLKINNEDFLMLSFLKIHSILVLDRLYLVRSTGNLSSS